MAYAIERQPIFDRVAYFGEAQSWSADVVAGLRRSRRRAWIVAAIAGSTSFTSVLAVALLTPLKTAVPYVIEVERATGYARAARIAEPGVLSENEAVRQANLFHYVKARETIDSADIAANYEQSLAWSADAARRDYLALWDPASPGNLVGRYPLGTVIAIRVKSISPLAPQTALVRFSTLRRTPGGGPVQVAHWQAVIAYRYADRPMTQDERFINPLGFQVTSYRKDPDAAPGEEIGERP